MTPEQSQTLATALRAETDAGLVGIMAIRNGNADF